MLAHPMEACRATQKEPAIVHPGLQDGEQTPEPWAGHYRATTCEGGRGQRGRSLRARKRGTSLMHAQDVVGQATTGLYPNVDGVNKTDVGTGTITSLITV